MGMRRPPGFAAACLLLWGVSGPALALDCVIRSDSPSFLGDTVAFALECQGPVEGKVGWDFGDGATLDSAAGAVSARHAFAVPGGYEISAQIEGSPFPVIGRHSVLYRPTPAAPTRSTTLLYEKARARVWCVNQDNNSISVFDADGLARLKEIPVGRNPRTLAQDSLGRVWAVGQDDATLTVVDGGTLMVARTIALPRASRPYGICFDPRGGAAYVSLEGTGILLRLDAASLEVTGELPLFPSPRAIAVSEDGARILVTRYISPADHGEVADVRAEPFSLARVIPLAYEGVPGLAPGGEWGVPNALAGIAISPDGRRAWATFKKDNVKRGLFVSPTGGMPNFEGTVRTGVAQIDLAEGKEDRAARADLDNRSLADAVAFDSKGAIAYVATFTANNITTFDNASGSAWLSIEPYDAAKEITPDGLAFDAKDSLLFVHYFVTRQVGVFDVSRLAGKLDIRKVAMMPAVGTERLAPDILKGKRIFYNAGDTRMSRDRYQSCAVCHLDGASDGRVWDFTHKGEGLRRTTSLLGKAGMGDGPVHWSANFDEIQDFEHDMRDNFAGSGFMADADFHADGRDKPLGAPKAGLSPDLDALAAYVSSLTEARPSPFRNPDGSLTADAIEGQKIFSDPEVGCAVCHPPPRYTDSGPAAGPGGSAPGGYLLHDVGTLNPGSGHRLGDTLTGFDTPALPGIWESGPYLHDGSAATLMDVITTANPGDRHGRTSHLTGKQKDQLVAFLQQIESAPAPDPIRAPAPREKAGLTVRASGTGYLLRWTGVAPAEGARLSIFGLDGRVLARLRPEPAAGRDGALDFRWAGPGTEGRPAGVYPMRLEWRGGGAARRVFLAGR